jgi:predicted PurR-regulated permease PerM
MDKTVDLGKGSKFIVLASVCIVVAGLYFAQEVFIPLALAILFTFVLIVVGLAVCLVGFFAYELTTQVYQVATELPQYRAEIRAKVDRFRGGGTIQKTIENIENTVAPTSNPTSGPATKLAAALRAPPPSAQGPRPSDGPLFPYSEQNPLPVKQVQAETPVKTALEWAGGAVHTLATAFLVLIFVIFMLLNREDLRDRMIRLVGAGRLNVTTQAVSEAAERISKYLLSLALVNFCYGVCVAGGLWVIGKLLGEGHPFPNVLLWGLICGVSRFLPYVGTWLGAALPIGLSFGLFPHYGAFFATAGMFVTYEAIVSQFIEPYLYGARTGMSTIAVLASAVFWGWLWGPVGLLLSTPLTVILDIILGDEPVLEPPVRIYQRLLALDAEEAANLAREYLKTRPIEEVYGEILLPALALAEQDRHRGTLDEEREAFVRQNMRDLVEELSELNREQLKKKAAAKDASDDQKQAAAIAARGSTEENGHAVIPKGCTVNVVCLPAHDESDEIAGMMLAELLADRGYCAFAASDAKLASEMVGIVESRKAHLVVISALPPAATAHARYLCKRLRASSSEVTMIVGLWTAEGDLNIAKDRITFDHSVTLTTGFADALQQIQQLAQPVLVEANNAAVTAAPGGSEGDLAGRK